MKKKNIFLILAAVLLVILIIFLIFLQDKKLDVTSKTVTDLHESLGTVDINKCGGLITYSDKPITENDLSNENRLCMAYYNLADSQKTTENIPSDGKNDNKINICKVGESTTLTTNNEEETECVYQLINKSDLEASYLKLYGNKLVSEENFYISDKEACFKEGEKYYCGNAENYKISLIPETTIYRIIDKAIKKLNGEIVIYDYFLKISNNVCYSKNNNEENSNCTKELTDKDLSNDDEVIALVKKYGAIYKHTFKEDKNKNHYWIKSELK